MNTETPEKPPAWRVAGPLFSGCYEIVDDRGEVVALVHYLGLKARELPVRKNAALFAAAPDLYAFVASLARVNPERVSVSAVQEMARLLIAKAGAQ